MKRSNLFFFVIAIISFTSCEKERFSKDWELVFSEEFSSSIDTSMVWRKNYPWFRYNFDQVYLNKNALVRNGYLNLIAKKQEYWGRGVTYLDSLDILHDDKPNYRKFNFSSGMLFLNEKYRFGKFEVRCKIPSGKGLWPAFWLYGACGEELDVFEFDCEFTKEVHTARHKEVFCDDGITYHFPEKFNLNTDFSKGFHNFSLEWTDDRIAWYVDDELIREEIKFNDFAYSNSFPDSTLHLIVNLAVTGNFVKSDPDLSIGDSSVFLIDYIRIYQ